MVKRSHIVETLAGDAAPLEKPLIHLRDELILDEAEMLQSRQSRLKKELVAARTVQRYARAFLCRVRYLRHRRHLRRELEFLAQQRHRVASITIQKAARGMIARRQYGRMRVYNDEQRSVESGKKGKKAPPKKGAGGSTSVAPPNIPVTPEAVQRIREQALVRNINFVAAIRALAAGKYEEVLAALDAHLKGGPCAVSARIQFVVKKKTGSTVAAGGKDTQKKKK